MNHLLSSGSQETTSLITGSSSSHPTVSPSQHIVCSNALPVTPWTSRVAERLQGVVADAEVELLPSVSANALKFSFLL